MMQLFLCKDELLFISVLKKLYFKMQEFVSFLITTKILVFFIEKSMEIFFMLALYVSHSEEENLTVVSNFD